MTPARAAARGTWISPTLPTHWVGLLHGAMLALAVLYVLAFVQPELEVHARSGIGDGDGRFLFDSIAYFETSRAFEPGALVGALVGDRPGPPLSSLTNLALFIEGGLARTLFPWSPSLAILVMNYGLLRLALGAYRRIAEQLGFAWTRQMEALVVANPWVWLNMVSLTKEIWGLALVGAFALACLNRRWALLGLLGVLSVFVREVYLLLAVGMGVIALWRIPPWAYLAGVGLALGVAETLVGDLTGYRTSKTVDLGQQMAPLLSLMGAIQSIPFGHVIAFPVILAVNVASPALNPRSYSADLTAFYVHANTISSYVFLALSWRLGSRAVRDGLASIPRLPGRLLFAFAVLVTLYPISQHRYLLPALPLLVICALAWTHVRGARAQAPAGRSGDRYMQAHPIGAARR